MAKDESLWGPRRQKTKAGCFYLFFDRIRNLRQERRMRENLQTEYVSRAAKNGQL